MKSVRVCSHINCPELQPCPDHARPKNAPWSKDRDMAAHMKLRRYVITTRGPECERCHQQALDRNGKGLHLHHVKASDTPAAVILLCADCHRSVDRSAR